MLVDEMDSGTVLETVRRQVFTNQLGICAKPDCSARIMQDRTSLGQCAHIIPRRVGSHPREDYKTPLEDRNKENNLLYLCRDHHTIIDDHQHAELYTADVLRKWKKQHEEWAAGISKTKNSSYYPPELTEMLTDLKNQFTEQTNISGLMIDKLLRSCRDLLDRHLIKEATVLLNQIDLFLLGVDSKTLGAKADLLGAILLIRNEKIPEAKKRLLQIIKSYPHDPEAMMEYVELCDNVPEAGDDLERIEKLARSLAEEHPRFLVIDLTRKWREQEIVEIENIFGNWTDDKGLNAKLICLYALFCDRSQNLPQRDKFISQWEKDLPYSSRPHLFRVLFKTIDLLRSPRTVLSEKVHQVQETISFSKAEREKSTSKDPLHLRDQIMWLMQDIKHSIAYAGLSSDANDGKALTDSFITLIEQCYFDSFTNGILIEFLSNLRIEADQWRIITRKIQESDVKPSQVLIELLFLYSLQFKDLYPELNRFLIKYDYDDLSAMAKAIENDDAEEAAKLINKKKSSLFALDLLHTIANQQIGVAIADLLETNNEYPTEWLYARLRVFDLNRKEAEALEIIRKLPLEGASIFALNTIERITYRNKQWELLIPTALHLLNFDIPNFYRGQLHAELAIAYFERGDDTNAINYADLGLSQSSELGSENSQNLLQILGRSLARKGDYDKACEKFQQYNHIERHFSLLLEEAELYLKSTFIDKYETSLALIIKAFEESDTYSDELYVSAVMLLIELSNREQIPKQDELTVQDGLFVKLEDFPNWFYIGEENKSMGAECIRPNSPNYNAIIRKELLNEINWPADKFSRPNTKRKILQIVTAPAFLSHRAHEAMARLAQIGNQPIWSLQAIEDGSLNVERLNQFFKDRFQHIHDFFDVYISTPTSFSFLCAMEGELAKALSRIASERKGFIRFNNGTQTDIDKQNSIAREALGGKPFFIDGLSTLLLIEAKLLETVIEALPNLWISTSVIRMIRETAASLETDASTVGRGGFVDGKFQFSYRDKEREEAFRTHLLISADLLDTLNNRVIGKTYLKSEEDTNLDGVLPDYFVDAFRYSQEKDALILTDDFLLIESYKTIGVSLIPRHFSSFSLVRAMTENNLFSWEDYLKYFARLSSYRYQLLPISVDDMFKTVFPPTPSGLVKFAPRNLAFLNLPLILSQEYGIDDKTVSGILSSFFLKLILDDSVPIAVAEEIFALTILQGLAKREKRTMARAIVQFCQQTLINRIWVSQNCEAKLMILERQLYGFAQGIDPIIIESPIFLRNNH